MREEALVGTGEQTLLAVSGGMDSMVMAHLFQSGQLPFQVAHCNFGLRGTESDGDEAFVAETCHRWQVPFHQVRFDTATYAKGKGLSIQMAARELRYEWLARTAASVGCTAIATAHHLDDAIETFLINFTRGCGISGLHGILPKKGNIIRPLLWADRETIRRFAAACGIAFRTDRSNESLRYTRNLLRHRVVPVLQQVNPSLQSGAGRTFRRIQDAEALAGYALAEISRTVWAQIDRNTFQVDLKTLRGYPAPLTVLHHLLHPYGFQEAQLAQIWDRAAGQPGARFLGKGWNLELRGDHLILSTQDNSGGEFTIEEIPVATLPLGDGSSLSFRRHGEAPAGFEGGRAVCWVDEEQLQLPLVVRHWRPGDRFQPLGMGGKQRKLQDYFSDEKVPRSFKDRIWLLESAGRIVWVVGMRADERFKLGPKTRRFLEIRKESK